MVGPNYQKTSFRVPAVWGEQSEKTSGRMVTLAGWWRHLNDPVFECAHERCNFWK